jgi:hypothetical protein
LEVTHETKASFEVLQFRNAKVDTVAVEDVRLFDLVAKSVSKVRHKILDSMFELHVYKSLDDSAFCSLVVVVFLLVFVVEVVIILKLLEIIWVEHVIRMAFMEIQLGDFKTFGLYNKLRLVLVLLINRDSALESKGCVDCPCYIPVGRISHVFEVFLSEFVRVLAEHFLVVIVVLSRFC